MRFLEMFMQIAGKPLGGVSENSRSNMKAFGSKKIQVFSCRKIKKHSPHVQSVAV